jgi:hypothetical protein
MITAECVRNYTAESSVQLSLLSRTVLDCPKELCKRATQTRLPYEIFLNRPHGGQGRGPEPG